MTVPLDEYEALREGRGFVELTGWTSIALTGTDRQKFLNNFCTNDVKRLAPGQSCEIFITNVKGKVLGHGLADCRDDELVFITVPNQAEVLIEHLDRYIIREDVQLRDTTAERSYILVGPNLPAGAAPTARWIGWMLLGPDAGGIVEISTADASAVQKSFTDQGFVSCGTGAFDALRIEAGTPLFGVDFNCENLPQEVARNEQAISFTKGCYLGQETVARIDALGHVNQELTGAKFSGSIPPAAGAELSHDGAAVGRVTSATMSPRLGAPLAIATIRRQWLAPGTTLDSPVGSCEVVRLPLSG